MKSRALFAVLAIIGTSLSLVGPASAAQDDDTWDSNIEVNFTLKARTMLDADGDYKAIFDQQDTPRSDCHGGGNQIVVTLYKENGFFDQSQGAKNISKDCVRRSQSWFTNNGGNEMYYHIRNRDQGTALGEFDSRDA